MLAIIHLSESYDNRIRT